MANLIQVWRLKRGVKVWNKWRLDNPNIEIDLSEASFVDGNLRDVNLRGANLRNSDFRNGNLSNADFRDGNLSNTDFRNANLSNADFRGAKLVDCQMTITQSRKLVHIFILPTDVKLTSAELIGADFTGQFLSEIDFNGRDLSKTNFTNADLTRVQAVGTNFNSATLTGACIQDWNISSETKLKEVICDYIYLKKGEWNNKKHKYDFLQRRPSDPNKKFKPGELATLFQKALSTIDLIFSDGIDWKVLLLSLKELQDEYGEENIAVQAIERKTGGSFVIRVEIPSNANKGEVESYAYLSYENNLKNVEDQYRAKLKAKDTEIRFYKQQSADIKEIVKLQASRPINIKNETKAVSENKSSSDTFNNNLQGANIANFANQVKDNARQEANQYNYPPEKKQTLAEAAVEIQKLLQQLEKSNPTATVEQQQAYVDAAISPTLKLRCVGALKAGGETAIEEFLDNPYLNVGKAVVKGWMYPELG